MSVSWDYWCVPVLRRRQLQVSDDSVRRISQMRVLLSWTEDPVPSQSLPAGHWLVVLSARAVRASLPQC